VALELALGRDGALERGLLVGGEAGLAVAEVLVQPPRGDRAEAGGGDVRAVQQRPAPRVRLGVGVVEDRVRRERAAGAVVQDDKSGREQERHPVLVQREQHDDHEEVEVRLDRPVGEVHDDRRRGEQPERDERRAGAARADERGGGRPQRDRAALEGAVRDVVAALEPPQRDRDGVQPEEHEERAVAAAELAVGKRVAAGQQPAGPGRRAAAAGWRAHRHRAGEYRQPAARA
jgi:hypothetical protein